MLGYLVKCGVTSEVDSIWGYLEWKQRLTSVKHLGVMQRLISTFCLLLLSFVLVGQVITSRRSTESSPSEGQGVASKPWLNPSLSYGSVTDIDGNRYATIQIGTQVWMAENLRTTRYQNGDPIPNVRDIGAWSRLETGAWVHYENNSSYEIPYGKLYNWYVVSDSRNVCPSGWHVPTEEEWLKLSDYLGGEDVAGASLYNSNSQHWRFANQESNNSSGFAGLPGGVRTHIASDVDDSFGSIGVWGNWWSATEEDDYTALNWSLTVSTYLLAMPENEKKMGLSIRCVSASQSTVVPSDLTHESRTAVQSTDNDTEWVPYSSKSAYPTALELPDEGIGRGKGSYSGDVADGKPNGFGTCTWANGDKYEGEWRNGMREGDGTMNYHDGSRYIGEWQNNKAHGQGTKNYSDGSQYVGEYQDGLPNGQGTRTYDNGNKYVGSWKAGKWHGQGVYISANGARKSGTWVNGEYQNQASVQNPSLKTDSREAGSSENKVRTCRLPIVDYDVTVVPVDERVMCCWCGDRYAEWDEVDAEDMRETAQSAYLQKLLLYHWKTVNADGEHRASDVLAFGDWIKNRGIMFRLYEEPGPKGFNPFDYGVGMYLDVLSFATSTPVRLLQVYDENKSYSPPSKAIRVVRYKSRSKLCGFARCKYDSNDGDRCR